MEKKGSRLVGLGFDREIEESVVTLKATGDEIEKVLAYARKYSVPVVYRNGIFDMLSHLEPDDEVPDELMQVLELLIEEIRRDFAE